LTRRTDFRKANSYTGQKIKGIVDVSYKIDGVRMLFRDGKFVTRNDKTPPGFDRAVSEDAKEKIELFEDCELYNGSFFGTNGPLSQHEPEIDVIGADDVYPLDYSVIGGDHHFDPRLTIDRVENPSYDYVMGHLTKALELGYEGLVLRTQDRWYRVKPYYTADVYVTGWFEQLDKAKNPKGQLGGFDTNYGKVTAFSDKERVALWENPAQYVGRLIEVVYRELYDTGKFRYCVTFSRFRDDKDEESFDTKQWSPT
jgi:hypothetical protein